MGSDAPRVAVTTTIWPRGSHGLLRVEVGVAYLHVVEGAGGVPVLLTPAHFPRTARAVLDLCHGLFLTGGEDVEPHRFGEAPHPALEEVNALRDEMEIAAVRDALARGMPILAVCRGIQLLNVALGGDLWQDLPAQLGGDVLHQQAGGVAERAHPVRVEPGSRLAAALGVEELAVNSFHHQAVRAPAPGLRATAHAPDGVVEGVEGTGPAWVLGVQWHPERGEAHALFGSPLHPDRRLFSAFVEAAARFAAE